VIAAIATARRNGLNCRVIYSFDQSNDANVRVLRPEVADAMNTMLGVWLSAALARVLPLDWGSW